MLCLQEEVFRMRLLLFYGEVDGIQSTEPPPAARFADAGFAADVIVWT